MGFHNKIKVFKWDEYAVVFNGTDLTLKLFPAQPFSGCNSKDVDNIQDFADLPLGLEHSRSDVADAFPSCVSQNTISEQRKKQRPAIHRLSLAVSNACNMACRYCYANGGRYYGDEVLMDKATALNAVNFASRNFSVIEHINFFGGEPTLNEQIIELVCEYFKYLHTRGILPRLPRFGLTTNGYAISSRMLQIIHKYNFSVSISLDGPKEIHDRLRVSKDGSGTYDVIVENIKAIMDMGIIPEFECTYTSEHYQQGIDIIALMDFFYENFQCRILHCPTVIADPNSRWFIPFEIATELYGEAIRYSMSNLMRRIPKSLSVATRLLNSLATRIPIHHYCPAGKSSMTINADGNIFACFLLMRTEFFLGNVNGNRRGFGHPTSVSILLQEANKWQNPACRDCWAQPLCFGCLGEDIAREGTLIRRSVTLGQSSICDFRRKLIEIFLISVAGASLQSCQ